MKPINCNKLKIIFPLALLIYSQVFSQSFKTSNTKENIIKTNTKSVESVQSTRNDNNKNEPTMRKELKNLFSVSLENEQSGVKVHKSTEDAGTNEGVSLDDQSVEENNIEINVDVGKQNTQTLTVQNSCYSPLIWSLAPEGNEKLLYRLYDKDRNLLKLKNNIEQKTDAVLTSEVYKAKETLMKVKDSNMIPETILTDVNLYKQKQQINQDNLINKPSDSYSSESSDNIELQQTLKISKINKSTGISSLMDNNIEDKSNKITDKSKLLPNIKILQKDVDGINPENLLEVFEQWFQFSDHSRPEFEPKNEVWEVSCDSGVHWQQILNINGEKYVTNAKSFDPAFYLEYHVIKKRNSPYSKLTLLSEYVKQAERGPAIFPKSGIIPSNTSANIELEVDATSLQKGTYNSTLILTDVNTMEVIEVTPIRINVVSKSENEVANKLSKENDAEGLPDKYELSQNYPNPFNPSTRIKYSILVDGLVTLKVYDVLGSEVTTLVNENKQTGYYEIEFNASSLASGIYLYRLQAGIFVETKKMVLTK